ncbi:uncharacterized protein V1513DRAFT_457693 [Lipomyces chichibuensis]|uniref:uncharacterized protein n=1 Tax=Lipomyces chichibuensis TaxID=1546026 RepID=UPI003343B7B3
MSKREKLKVKNHPRRTESHHNDHAKSSYEGDPRTQYYEELGNSYIELSILDNPQLVVTFKSLQKRDPTTKEKALDSLVTYLQDPESVVEESTLAVWIQFYPQLASDFSRRLRMLAHKVQGDLFKRFQRLSAKYMKDSVGPWLGGLYDNDKVVARTAAVSFESVFSSEEKRKQVFQVFHVQLLDYVKHAISTKDNHTSSDEKYFTHTEIESKVDREIACGISLFSYLLGHISPEAIEEQQYDYAEIVTSETLWKSLTSADSHLSRAALGLIVQLAYDYTEWLGAMPRYLGRYLVSNGLMNISSGAVLDYLECLVTVTRLYPTAWTPSSETNEPSFSLLLSFVSQGSRYAGPRYWHYIEVLIENLPASILDINDISGFPVNEIANVFVTGILTENRMTVDSAVDAYLSLLVYFTTVSEVTQIQRESLSKAMEVGDQYALMCGELGKKIGTDSVARSLTAYLRKITQEHDQLAIQFWQRMVDILLKKAVENTAEGRDVDVKEMVTRWIRLAKRIAAVPEELMERIGISSEIRKLVDACLSSVKSCSGSLPIRAYILESLLNEFFSYVKSDELLIQSVDDFVVHTIPALISSPSSTHLINIWVNYEHHVADTAHAKKLWQSIIKTLLASSLAETKDTILVYLLESLKPLKGSIAPYEPLEDYALQKADVIFNKADSKDWDVIVASLISEGYTISEQVAVEILNRLARASSFDSYREDLFFKHLIPVSQKNFTVFSAFIKTEEGRRLASRLWQLTESIADVSDPAKVIRQRLEGQLNISQSTDSSDSSLFESLASAILTDVENDPETSCASLVTRSISLWETANADTKSVIAPKLLFGSSRWRYRLEVALSKPIAPSVSLVNNIAGGLYLVNDESLASMSNNDALGAFDDESAEDKVKLFRMASYALELIRKTDAFEYLPYFDKLQRFLSFQVISELAKDEINEYGTGKMRPIFGNEDLSYSGVDDLLSLTERSNERLESQLGSFALRFIGADTFSAGIHTEVSTSSKDDQDFIRDVVTLIGQHTRDKTVFGFYAARVLENTVSYIVENADFQVKDAEQFFEKHKLRRSKDVLASVAIFQGMSKYVGAMTSTDRLRNEIASDIIGIRPALVSSEALNKIILLNSLVYNIDDPDFAPFPPQRAIMLLKRLLDFFPERTAENLALRSETAKLLLAVLPVVKGLYGEHWNRVFNFVSESLAICEDFLTNDTVTPLLFYTLKVLVLVKSFQDDNDDIADLLAEDSDIMDALIRILGASVDVKRRSQARLLCDAALSRQILEVPVDKISDPTQLLPILSVESEPLQKTILMLEKRVIPVAQESLAMEAALDTHGVLNIELPVELLSLVMSIPEAVNGDFEIEEIRAAGMDAETRAYLYSWKLIFEYFENAPFALKTKYVESLKEGDYIDTILNLLASILHLTSGKPPDASKLPFTRYDPDEALDTPVQDLQWLLLHIYYQLLRHVPSVVRKWWAEIRNRQLSLAVESFTQKYFSPVLIDSELQSVQAKLAEAEIEAEDENMQVKVSRVTHEVAAVYSIDEQTMEMIIRVPTNFPLHDVHVDGVKRVGVKENQWRAWLLASQSVITSQNGNIVDALVLFRRNVNLHFEGVTECAICYSILHQDRSLPNKRCQTCKNKFHAGCLYKWFQSANSSSCPLCRQPFSFGR